MVADGQPVPRGGGQYLVGHPYTIAGRTYYPSENSAYSAVGMASWYGDAFQGRRTANGEVYDKSSLSAAHPTMPLPSYARVTNLANGYSIIVRVNDRGPFHGGRVMDVSSRVADLLDFKSVGTTRVKVEYVGRAPLEGSDDSVAPAHHCVGDAARRRRAGDGRRGRVGRAGRGVRADRRAAARHDCAKSQIVESAAAATAPVRSGEPSRARSARSPRRRRFRRDGPSSRRWPASGPSISRRARARRFACCGMILSLG